MGAGDPAGESALQKVLKSKTWVLVSILTQGCGRLFIRSSGQRSSHHREPKADGGSCLRGTSVTSHSCW